MVVAWGERCQRDRGRGAGRRRREGTGRSGLPAAAPPPPLRRVVPRVRPARNKTPATGAGVLQGGRMSRKPRGTRGSGGPRGGRRVGCPAAPAVTASTKEEYGLVAVSCALGTMSSVAVATAGRFRGLQAPGWRYRADRRRSVLHSAGALRRAAGAPVSLRSSGPSPWPGGRCREFIARALLRKGEPERGQERWGTGRHTSTVSAKVSRSSPAARNVPGRTWGCLRAPCPFPAPSRLPPLRRRGGGTAATGGSRRSEQGDQLGLALFEGQRCHALTGN